MRVFKRGSVTVNQDGIVKTISINHGRMKDETQAKSVNARILHQAYLLIIEDEV